LVTGAKRGDKGKAKIAARLDDHLVAVWA
jgi:hypothetical protein